MPLYTNQSSTIVAGAGGAAVTHTGNTNETTLATITIPGGQMGANGQIEVEVVWGHTNSANNKTLRLRFNGSNINQSIVTTSGMTRIRHRVANRNVQNSQVHFSGTSTTSGGAPSTMAHDTSAAFGITITGQLALASETITLESYAVHVYPRA